MCSVGITFNILNSFKSFVPAWAVFVWVFLPYTQYLPLEIKDQFRSSIRTLCFQEDIGSLLAVGWCKAIKKLPKFVVFHTLWYLKTCLYLGKQSFSLNKNLGQCLLQAQILFEFFLLFVPFLRFTCKKVKKHISTSVWSAQHPNNGQNIQHYVTYYVTT